MLPNVAVEFDENSIFRSLGKGNLTFREAFEEIIKLSRQTPTVLIEFP